ncbi:sulfurtransferase [Pseudomonas sp. CCC3.1]|uniref:sulfurtransferase n=1 Tax=Pseudomonas sp. CCC3.1 TaxID=3048607 RepID=UPI002AC9DB76|nr:rhodanese-like domain-containing protein [Pseudomonas sp. CCC3.1]MEB0203970.1 rhodanese-like domain-containing protein [Pseudomonas sp. CCC3.1]WPX37797.1 rhodanese-like domain-containing protein [Pseudomonas sp. CCC3.1]
MTSPLLSIDSLLAHLEHWTVLEACANGLREPFDAGHLPGAQFADLVSALSDPLAPFPYTRPDALAFSTAMRRLGVFNQRPVVIYDRENGIWAARVWWLLKSFGHTQALVLEGGLCAWLSRDLPLHTAPAPARYGDFTAVSASGYFVDRAYVQQVLAGQHNAQLVNVLRRPVFRGEESKYARPGHIPNSINLPFVELIDPHTHAFISGPALHTFLQPLTARPDVEWVLYCGSGITAAGFALALAVAGIHRVSVYDGSLCEWSADPALPMNLAATPAISNT